MPRGPIRRGQLITPFGTGAMIIVRDGTSLICSGLDHWYKREDLTEDSRSIDPDEYLIDEWRLQRLLRVDSLRLPPDYRKRKQYQDDQMNLYLTVPFLRFPQYHFCPLCKKLTVVLLTRRDKECCDECQKKGRKIYLVQVPFVAMCDRGHLQDFPWQEWVHKSSQPSCTKTMRLIATGGSTLASQTIICECGAKRNLSRITEGSPDETKSYLSEHLDAAKKVFTCQGKKPWLGIGIDDAGDTCDRPLKGSLRSASNLYYAHVQSSIYIPRGDSSIPSDLIQLLEQPPLSTLIHLLKGVKEDINPVDLRQIHRELLQPFTDDEISAGLKRIFKEAFLNSNNRTGSVNEDEHTAFRRVEFEILRFPRTEDQLSIRVPKMSDYDRAVSHYFSRITLIDKLRETRVLAGFSRIFPEDGRAVHERQSLLWRNPPEGLNSGWLPGYKVFGEGIFLEINESKLKVWEKQKEVCDRAQKLERNYYKLKESRHLFEKAITPRFVLLHSLAHLIINQMTFECGYSSASLRERLYVSADEEFPMAGILIYTAAGDADGSMGGLVRMGKPGYFEPVLIKALDKAKWCSADPVCMEMGDSGGQGPDSCNLAACHNCELVPETACEEFNRFLDRAFVIGDNKNTNLAYFK